MFNKIKALLEKRRANKKKEEAAAIYTVSHMILVLYNNLKIMQSISEKEKTDLFKLYIKTLEGMMTQENKILFTRALLDANQAIQKIYENIPNSQVQIKRQLEEIFRSTSG